MYMWVVCGRMFGETYTRRYSYLYLISDYISVQIHVCKSRCPSAHCFWSDEHMLVYTYVDVCFMQNDYLNYVGMYDGVFGMYRAGMYT